MRLLFLLPCHHQFFISAILPRKGPRSRRDGWESWRHVRSTLIIAFSYVVATPLLGTAVLLMSLSFACVGVLCCMLRPALSAPEKRPKAFTSLLGDFQKIFYRGTSTSLLGGTRT